MYTLFLDTHDKNVLVILYKDGKILNKENLATINKHSEVTMPTIEKILKESNVDVRELNNIIVVNGPGSFTGERIAVTIAKTIAYCLNIPIRVLDALTVLAINIEADNKIVAIEDKNGAYVGSFDNLNKSLEPFKYLSKSLYSEFKESNKVNAYVNVDYEKVFEYAMSLDSCNPHEVKPLYIKGISALDGK